MNTAGACCCCQATSNPQKPGTGNTPVMIVYRLKQLLYRIVVKYTLLLLNFVILIKRSAKSEV
jgi:hypothetical protein